MSGQDDAEEVRKYQAPYSAKHPIPTIGKYRAEKQAREQRALEHDPEDDDTANEKSAKQPQDKEQQDCDAALKDTSETSAAAADPKQRRKQLQSSKKERAEREVTDPVTHLPVTIHDFTDEALKETEPNNPAPGATKKTSTGLGAKQKSQEQLDQESDLAQDSHNALADRFPPPDFDALRQELVNISKRGFTFGLSGITVIACIAILFVRAFDTGRLSLPNVSAWVMLAAGCAAASAFFIQAVRDWTTHRINGVFEDEVWDAHHRQTSEQADKHSSETTVWLTSLLEAVWPLVNPDLFASLGDTLEDVMQASLPRFIRMMSVDDIGQGSESLRILGVRWLPTGAAARSVQDNGRLSTSDEDDDDEQQPGDAKQPEEASTQGMEAEEGDFVNLEVAFAYRSRSTSKSLKARTKDMHLYLAFYLPGGIKVPVWVDLQGLIGTMRLRLQLTPDPPFFALCTMTFLGQPKVNLSCTPLSKHAVNIMDVPFISRFVQSSVDAAMAEYVAPKSLTLDLKDMLAGDDFKKDTNAKGILMVNIKRGYDFKMGDQGIPLIQDGSADPYVSVGWAKFGKVLWSTRILKAEMEPCWDETCFVLVTPEELNVGERLRIQLWDADRMSADDDLGRIEVDLKELMTGSETNGQMADRTDGFRALKSGDNMPGKLQWSVGYFSKARIQPCQFEQQSHDPKVRNMDQLKKKVDESCEKKLRETMFKQGQSKCDENELKQQKDQEFKVEQDAMIISAPPPQGYPSGLFSLQIHNITGLELGQLSKTGPSSDADSNEEEETGEGLPSAYCEIIINHRKTFKTRTKPQNAKPFFNAGCERFIRDWRECEAYVAVRDLRQSEDDALLGIVHLPLETIFQERSQFMGFWPLTGGVGHGRIRLSMVWRSVQLQAPTRLLGWHIGTVEISSSVTSSDCSEDLRQAKLKFRTDIGKGKMKSNGKDDGWQAPKDRNLRLPVQNRYSTCLSIVFKKKTVMKDSAAAFCVMWLKDITDGETQELDMPIWKGDLKRATANSFEDCGEKCGTLKVKMTFWAGMGGAHSQWASKTQSTREVVEVIDTARDNLQDDKMEKEAGIVDEEASSDSDTDTSDDDDDDSDGTADSDHVPDGSAGHKQGPIDQIRDYTKKNKALHRQHRGIMQWKAPRTTKWVKHKIEHVQEKLSGTVDLKTNAPDGVETEV